MDRISLFSDDLILKILSFGPTKDAITTSLLSKRWRYLWKHVPNLEYCDSYVNNPYWKAQRFIDTFFQQHKAAVLETLQLMLGRCCHPREIEAWIDIATARGMRNLNLLQYRPVSGEVKLPMSLYTCQSLVALKLYGDIIVDVPSEISFKSLKTLWLGAVKFSSDEVVQRLLSSSPILEDLTVIRRGDDSVKIITIVGPFLKKLTVRDTRKGSETKGVERGFLISAPSLEYLRIFQRFSWFRLSDNVPKLVHANINIRHAESAQLLGCLTSAKHLRLTIKAQMISYPTMDMFDQLVSLRLRACSSDWFGHMIIHTPNLQDLDIGLIKTHSHDTGHLPQAQWKRPSSVPECLISSLKTVEWIKYKGTQAEKKGAIYILKKATLLHKLVIKPSRSKSEKKRNEMLIALASVPKRSSKCQLLFS